MASLPLGWEWDYDGTRWFYKYKPNGHIQYHFPTEGDEFPDFVVAGAPNVDLAPEERLESQQQVRRITSTSSSTKGNGNGQRKKKGNGMSATARPVSCTWEDGREDDEDGEEEGQSLFQPENFMFLGPGTYTDISPLAEDEEEAAKRAVAGKAGDPTLGVSPMASRGATPKGINSQLATTLTSPAVPEEPQVHMLDSREMPHELPVEGPLRPFDPVGVMAEMATGETAIAKVETEPVEMADNGVRAPIEFEVPDGYAELPEDNQVTTKPGYESKAQETKKGHAKENSREPENVAIATVIKSVDDAIQQLKTGGEKLHTNGSDTRGYQAYTPGHFTEKPPRSYSPEKGQGPKTSDTFLQREKSLMMGNKPQSPPTVDHPTILSPPQPQIMSNSTTPPPASGVNSNTTAIQNLDNAPSPKEYSTASSHTPSILRPAGNTANTNIQSSSSPPSAATVAPSNASPQVNSAEQKQQETSINKFPSILKPARGKAPNNNSGNQPPPTNGFVPPPVGVHPPSITPASDLRPIVQRVSTVPTQQNSQNFMPYRHSEQSIVTLQQLQPRPASVMPGAESTHYRDVAQHKQQPQNPELAWQKMRMPYGGLTQALPSTAPPPTGQAGPFAAPSSAQPAQTNPHAQSSVTAHQHQQQPQPAFTKKPIPTSQQSLQHSESARNASRRSSIGQDVSPVTSQRTPSFPVQTPSPMSQRPRHDSASTTASENTIFTPSPVSRGSQPQESFSTPPSTSSQGPPVPGKVAQSENQSYFPLQGPEGHGGHAASAQARLRKKSIGRADFSKRNSIPTEQLLAMAKWNSLGPPGAGEQSQQNGQPHQASQGGEPPADHLLGRIEEREESSKAPPPIPGKVPFSPKPRNNQMVPGLQQGQESTSSTKHQLYNSQVPEFQIAATKPTLQGQPKQNRASMPPLGRPHAPTHWGPQILQPSKNLLSAGQPPSMSSGQMISSGQPQPGNAPQGRSLHPRTSSGQLLSSYSPQQPYSNQMVQQGLPPGQNPSNNQMWHSNMAMSQGARPGSVPPPGPKEKKWLKWLTGNSKSVSYSPSIQPQMISHPIAHPQNGQPQQRQTWGGSDFAKPAVWQPGQSVKEKAQDEQRMGPTQLGHLPAIASLPPTSTRVGPPPLTGSSQSGSSGMGSMSDSTSLMASVDIGQAQSQPVMKPQVIEVHRRSQEAMLKLGPHPGPLSSHPPNQAPFISGHARTSSSVTSESQRSRSSSDAKSASGMNQASVPAHRYTTSNSPTSGKIARQSQPSEASRQAGQQSHEMKAENSWHNKPAGDYSGGGWGDGWR